MNEQFFDIVELRSGIKLNEQQKNAVLHNEGPALVLAVPGSGKTTMLLCRTANLIMNHGIKPSNILTLTFNRAAVRDMDNRFNRLFGWMDVDISFSTIHAFALKVVRNRFGRELSIIEGDNAAINKNSIIKKLYYEQNREYISDDKLDELSRCISYVKNMMLTGQEINDFKCSIESFGQIYKRYESIKKNYNYVDFDDMLSISYDILKNNQSLVKKYKAQYPYIQIDEFQDNSKIQNEIIRLICAPKNNLFAVADDDQSIYGFRGAYPQGVLKFSENFKKAAFFVMEQNYRSAKSITDMATEFIKANKQRYDKHIFSEKPYGKPIKIMQFRTAAEQAAFIADSIENALNECSKGLRPSNAVLFRNNISSIAVADEFYKRNISFHVKDGSFNFFRHWVVEDITAFIKLSIDSSDIESFRKIFYKCGLYASKQAADYMFEKHKSGSVFKTLKSCPVLSGFQLGKIISFEKGLSRLPYLSPADSINFIERELGYRSFINENSLRKGYSVDNIYAVMDSLKLIAARTKTAIEFLARLSNLFEVIQNARYNKEEAAVVLSTVHSAKGLEFTNVYVIDLADGTFPGAASIEECEKGDAASMEEERRLFYVGMTRAKKELVLCSADTRNDSHVFASRFITELNSIMGNVQVQRI